MKVSIKDTIINITSKEKFLLLDKYHIVCDVNQFLALPNKKKKGKILIENITKKEVPPLFDFLKKIMDKSYKGSKIKNIILYAPDKDDIIRAVKKQFQIVKAGGGVIFKEDKVLFIYRLNKWDLPKGKQDKGEDVQETAIREVEEECGVKAKVISWLCTSYHTYIRNKKHKLKEIRWYKMQCIDDSKMKPQIEENIEKTEWVAPKNWDEKLKNSYKSIKKVMKSVKKSS